MAADTRRPAPVRGGGRRNAVPAGRPRTATATAAATAAVAVQWRRRRAGRRGPTQKDLEAPPARASGFSPRIVGTHPWTRIGVFVALGSMGCVLK